jgi:hypothetical protein
MLPGLQFWEGSFRFQASSSGKDHSASRLLVLGRINPLPGLQFWEGSFRLPGLQFWEGSFHCQASSSGKVHSAARPPVLGRFILLPGLQFWEGSYRCQASSSGRFIPLPGLQFLEGTFRWQASSFGKVHYAARPPVLGRYIPLPAGLQFWDGSFYCQAFPVLMSMTQMVLPSMPSSVTSLYNAINKTLCLIFLDITFQYTPKYLFRENVRAHPSEYG